MSSCRATAAVGPATASSQQVPSHRQRKLQRQRTMTQQALPRARWPTLRCARCKVTPYCSKHCQKRAWVEADAYGKALGASEDLRLLAKQACDELYNADPQHHPAVEVARLEYVATAALLWGGLDVLQCDATAVLLRDPKTVAFFINVGANKGYSALEFLSLWTAHRVSGQRWKRVVFSYKGGGGSLKQRACGNCSGKVRSSVANGRTRACVRSVVVGRASWAIAGAGARAATASGVHHAASTWPMCYQRS